MAKKAPVSSTLNYFELRLEVRMRGPWGSQSCEVLRVASVARGNKKHVEAMYAEAWNARKTNLFFPEGYQPC